MRKNGSSTIAAIAALAALAAFAGCAGGGGGGDAGVISEALVSDGAGCRIRAEVDSGHEVPGGVCLAFVDFDLIDTEGNELDIDFLTFPGLLPAGKRYSLDLRICRGRPEPLVPQAVEETAGSDRFGPPRVFLMQGADRCPTAPSPDAFQGRAVSAMEEVSCEEISRLVTNVGGGC